MHNRLSWAQAACSRILRPMVRLALAMGLKHSHLEDLLRDLLLDEARRIWHSKGVRMPNISQLAVTTGLNRKEVTLRVHQVHDHLPRTELSSAAKTFTLWLQLVIQDPSCRRLFIMDNGTAPSFEALAKQASRGDVHHRAVLDELIRLGMATEHQGQVELATDGYVPAADLQAMLAFVGDNVCDHLQAAVSNTLGESPRMLERAVYAEGLTQQDCEQIHQLTRQRWERLHHELVGEMSRAVHGADGAGGKRIRVGIYTYYEDTPAEVQTPETNNQSIPGAEKS
ncbi:MAG: DUF6502 family protein [Burkholderiaceae bacterium]